MQHAPECRCRPCQDSADITQRDRDCLARTWAEWISTDDVECAKLRAGMNGAPGSPRWAALKAIAAARREGAAG